MKRKLASLAVAASVLLAAAPALAQTEQEVMMERGEGMMDVMMGADHEAFDRDLESRYGREYVDRTHETMGRMSFSGMGGSGMMSMMRMMGGGYGGYGMMGDAVGYHAFVSWLWVIVWTANSILVGLALWTYVRKNTGK